jgi:1,4-alpha-glucan branching enzyme
MALGRFDGSALYEHLDPRKGEHPDWGTYIFQLRPQRSAQLSDRECALLVSRVSRRRAARRCVASMLYLDYSRKEGQWVPNEFGGRENLEALAFLKGVERNHAPRVSGHHDDRGGIDGVAHGQPSDLRRRTRF